MNMVKNEWKKLFHNKVLLISFIAILFIPIMYASFFLKSVWDPYGKASHLPVAVVNLDETVEFQGQKMDVGNQLVAKLKKDDSLDWRFVSEKEAKQGMKDLKYYMIVTLPKDFSKNATTLLDENPKKMEIGYETNGSLNFIGEEVTKMAMEDLKAQVGTSVTKGYAETIFAQVGKLGNGIVQAADGAEQIADGGNKLSDGNKEITANLDKLANSMITFKDGANAFNVGLNQYASGVEKANNGAAQLDAGTKKLASNVGPLKNGIAALDTGANQLSSGVGQYTSGVNELNKGTSSALVGSSSLTKGLNDLNNQLPNLENGVGELQTGLEKLNTGSVKLKSGLETLDSNLSSPASKSQIAELQSGLNQFKTGITELNQQVNNTQLTTIVNKSKAIEPTINKIEEHLAALEALTSGNHSEQIIAKIEALETLVPEDKAKLINDIKPILDDLAQKQNEIIQMLHKDLEEMSQLLADVPDSIDEIEALQSGVSQLNNGFNGNPGIYSGTNALIDSMVDIQKAVGSANDQNTLLGGATVLHNGIADATTGVKELNEKVPSLADGVNQLTGGSQALNNGLKKINDGTTELDNKSGELNSGATKLANGMNAFSGQLPALSNGINALNNGAIQLADGTNELADKVPKLQNGAVALSNGAGEIQNGSAQLAAGSAQLGTGIDKLNTGATKLAAGSQQMSQINPTNKNFNMFASPDKVNHKNYSTVPNYGAALAPYVMSLALYVGALVFNFVFPIRKISMRGQTSTAWWASKASVGVFVAIVMALIQATVMLVLGLHIDSLIQFYAMAITTSLAYMFIIMFLAMTFDNPGRFVAMILLIVQLGGAGGTFPMPLTNGFFNAIHPFLPMTYSIYGFRQAITSGIGMNVYFQSLLVLVGIFAVFIGLLWLGMKQLQKKHLEGVSQLDNNQELQAVED
ncbi:YhgE/Pip domain-containing protein [Listeria monocytogenes]|uniref:YhgE/Pip domain-containing protein n=1 Tax=Listeria monocytogenes TaxID=1639 RepID=UPI000BDFB12D|nr:YhgE/Pip domain-containing protein [Listeria monocytogenes]EAD1107991.1 YhgE/Pip domain-containing protein [Listeria monocytogenes]EAD2952703.1 YhgE/Pip domain-containing protein [Listeria monocytogenes]EAD2967612.1 YhgE/Pip domain-containing protein [Listeria monocytogenes]EDI8394616.1 YhgE/Pip domain-containing protein [Listeria monocytogenes]PDL60059.1 phage infection protein [Listeria monocytogenes]